MRIDLNEEQTTTVHDKPERAFTAPVCPVPQRVIPTPTAVGRRISLETTESEQQHDLRPSLRFSE
jgi:hypothetical protein